MKLKKFEKKYKRMLGEITDALDEKIRIGKQPNKLLCQPGTKMIKSRRKESTDLH